jgi:hypothetical protein
MAKSREVTSLAVARIAREMETVARGLATYCLHIELAAARRDWPAVHDAAEVVESLVARLTELRRGLLVLGATHIVTGLHESMSV